MACGKEGVANLGRDREPGRHRQSESRHLGKIGALPAQKLGHAGAALGFAGDEGVNPFPFAVGVRLCHQTSDAVFMPPIILVRSDRRQGEVP